MTPSQIISAIKASKHSGFFYNRDTYTKEQLIAIFEQKEYDFADDTTYTLVDDEVIVNPK